MFKKFVIQAIFIGFGCALGGSVMPRLMLPGAFGPSYPPIWAHALEYFAVSGIAAFAVFALIDLVHKLFKK